MVFALILRTAGNGSLKMRRSRPAHPISRRTEICGQAVDNRAPNLPPGPESSESRPVEPILISRRTHPNFSPNAPNFSPNAPNFSPEGVIHHKHQGLTRRLNLNLKEEYIQGPPATRPRFRPGGVGGVLSGCSAAIAGTW